MPSLRERVAALEQENERLRTELARQPRITEAAREGEHERTAEQLRKTELLLRIFAEHSQDAIFRLRVPNGEYDYVSPAAAAISGYTPEEFYRTPLLIQKLIHPDWQESFRQGWAALCAGQAPPIIEYPILTKSGEVRWLQQRNWLEFDEQRKPVAFEGVVIDITERRRAEEALQESEDRFSKAFHASPMAMGISTLQEGRFIEVNEAAMRIFGYTREEAVGRTSRELGLYVDEAEREAMIAALRREDRVVNRPMRLRTKSGEIRDCEFSTMPIQARGGQCLLVAVSDVTGRKQAEEALRQSEEHYRAVFSTAAEGILIADIESKRFKHANPAICRLLGYAAEKLTTLSVADIHPPQDLEWAVAEFMALARGEKTVALNVPCRRHDGTVVYADISTARVVFDGTPCNVGFFTDVTERRQAEEALRASERQYRATIDSMGDAIHVVDADLRLVLANHALTEWNRKLGLRTDVLGRTVFEVFPFLSEAIRDEYGRVFNSGETLITEEQTAVAGRPFVTETRKIPVFEAGKVARVVTVIRDITESRRDQERLRQSEKMEALGQLAGGIAHDFNNQLAAILGYAELLGSRLADEELRLFANVIARTATRSADLTRQLLAFARKGTHQSVPVDIHALINEVVALLSRTVDKRITIKQLLAANPSATMGDPIQLQNAFLNLAINARDAMPNGGELVFSTGVEVLDEQYCGSVSRGIAPGRYLQVCVTDTGVGMSEETQKRLFEPFFTTKEPGKGTGMGLAAVYGTVMNHRGAISVRSDLGRGSSFTLHLPLVEPEAGPEAVVAAERPVHGAAHILLAEDEAAVRAMVATSLRQLGYRVTAFTDGAEALAYYRTAWQEVDLVILDVVMPNLGGRDALTAMRHINPALRSILSSGYSLDGQVQTLLDQGAVDFIQKPFHLGELSRKVAAALRR